MRLILFQPDIPQNTGALFRLAACFGIRLEIIGPLGYVMDNNKLRRAGMDYVDRVDWQLHSSWEKYRETHRGRLIVLSTKASQLYWDYSYREEDCLVLGRESSGLPPEIHQEADIRLRIPIQASARSLNVAQAAAIVLGEAQRQLHHTSLS